MKTALVSPCYLDGNDKLGNNRIKRNQRYINYYAPLKETFGFEDIWLIDNGSNYENISEFKHNVQQVPYMELFPNIPERGGLHDYPWCWRALWFIRELFCSYDKIIFIDSDHFVLTKAMADYIRNLESGWVSFWSLNGRLPDSSVWVLNRDAFPIFQKYTEKRWEDKVGIWMEKDLPFTVIETEFNCSRYGELAPTPEQAPHMDMYGQASLETELIFSRWGT